VANGPRRKTGGVPPGDVGAPPPDGAPPPHINPESQQTGMLVRALQEALKDSVSELRADIAKIETHARSDHRWLTGAFATGVVIVFGALVTGYFHLDDKIQTQSTRVETKIDAASSTINSKIDTEGQHSIDRMDQLGMTMVEIKTKLADLLERIPPVPTPPSHR
jgi:hypothetical protein